MKERRGDQGEERRVQFKVLRAREVAAPRAGRLQVYLVYDLPVTWETKPYMYITHIHVVNVIMQDIYIKTFSNLPS